MKTGLVLEGGASRTYFSIGVMDALMEENVYTNYVIGTSAGIANGMCYVSKQIGRSLKIGLEYLHDKRYMGLRHLINPKNKSYYNIPFVFEDLPNKHLPFDYKTAESFNGECVATVTNLETGEAEYMQIDCKDKQWKSIVASCALPILFKPVQIGNSFYMDGGIVDPIPLQKAIDDGCKKNIVVVTREKEYVKTEEAGIGISAFLYKKYPNFVKSLKARTALYNKTHKELEEHEKNGTAFVIRPDKTSSWKRTESNPAKIKEMYDAGYEKAMEKMDEIKAYLEIK